MAKTRRLISENLSQVDAVLELLDARIPNGSKNPEILRLCQHKPILTLLNKSGLADPNATREWIKHYADRGHASLAIDCISGEGMKNLLPTVRELLGEKIQSYANKGMHGRKLKLMVVGVPNVGKSTLINRLAGRKRAKVEDRPGVTRDKQWVIVSDQFDLMDMPGVLWPKFEDEAVGENLAITGSIRDQILDIEHIATLLCRRLQERYPALLCERYKITEEEVAQLPDYDLLEAIGRKRGFLLRGGVVDTERTSVILLDEFRGGLIGRITLERIL
ncbi:MAG: ribosome biogenesis GTPase YlqF [Oscillospiraceae bacterium]|nr:ribosome biogenesis GTPase YlqF [Oscillospiraceae bacterium]